MSEALLQALADADFTQAFGVVTSVRSDWIVATGPVARIGAYCAISAEGGTAHRPALAEVVAVDEGGLRLAPLGPVSGIALGARVTLADADIPQPGLLAVANRAIDAMGNPIDGGAPLPRALRPTAAVERLTPLERATPSHPLTTGIRAIDGLLPLAQGQKIGIFAPSGAGKSSLLEELSLATQCDRIILCQVGERGREVDRAWRLLGSSEQQTPFTLVAATADESPSLRVRALELAIALAEEARAAGEHVLLCVDSVTRVAMALRELGVAAGQPPSARGYTANVFSHLPRQIERCGAVREGGAITTVLSVLSETEDVDDPIVELMKSILDGHIVLSRALAERRHFPAIDIGRSISRLAEDILSETQAPLVDAVYRLHADYEGARAMIESGIYTPGSRPEIDRAIAAREPIDAFLRQARGERSTQQQTLEGLRKAGGPHG